MNELILHRGGQIVEKADLDLVPLPEATESYIPVSHYQLSERLLTISQDLLTDYALIGESYALARNGNQLFAVLNFKTQETDQMALSVAFRNSYDRSMSIGIAIGANVFVCDNLALHGDIAVMKKHTKNVWGSLEDTAITALYRAQHRFQKLIIDSQTLQDRPMDDRQAFEMMGRLFGEDIVSPRQLTVLKDEWLHPSHEEFQPRNAWSFYNSATHALKTCPPQIIMEKHSRAHECIL